MTTPEPGSRLIGGRYRLERSIGAGGMGTVWAGRDELLDRAVAVKEVRFPAGLGAHEQAALRERTLREARATARLSHPNVVATYDVVEEDGRPCIVMELLAARSLSAVLREDGPLSPHRTAVIGLALLGALEVSHQQGVVHRDVKPGNVLVTPDGRPVLTDFGIATMSGDPSLTSTGVVLGSPAYMSPERARGQRPGPEADLWSLGATLYAAVEGRPPFDGDNALGTLTAVISDPVDPPTVEGPLREAVLGLLTKDPADRLDIATARALLERAAADHSGTAAAAPAVGALERAEGTAALPLDAARRRGPSRPAIAALLVVALIAGLAIIGFIASRGDGPFGQHAGASQSGAPSTSKAEPTKTDSANPSDTPSGRAAGGFRTYTDQTGFSVEVPQGWQVSPNGDQVDIREPGTTRFLRIAHTDSPKKDPKKDWERQEKSVSKRLDNYQRVSIETVDYRGYPAADWEFTFGTNTHVVNRGFVAGQTGYALYISSPEDSWDESRQIFARAAESFQPSG